MRGRGVMGLTAALIVVGALTTTLPAVGQTPDDAITVAYPDVPASWAGLDPRDTAAIDHFALWGLPLFRIDHAGQLRPGLATSYAVVPDAEGWAVDVTLRPGDWSDGRPVVAADVVATADVLSALRPGEWEGVQVSARDDGSVRIASDAPVARWAYLLSGPPGVLPGHVLADVGLEAYDAGIPVSGGSFALVEQDPGRGASFGAHPDGPMGPPGATAVEIATVPSYETALGLLDRGEVDVVLGHLAVAPVARAEELSGVRAGAPVGGTGVALAWEPDGRLGEDPEARRSIAAALDLSELVTGLLGATGTPMSSPVPGIDGPWGVATGRPVVRDVTVADQLLLLVPRWHEALGFTARVVQRDVRAGGGSLTTVAHESPTVLDPPEDVDVALRVVRSLPRPALGGGAGADVPLGPSATVAEELAPLFAQLQEDERTTPLYRIGVAHAWKDVEGLRPSSWPGLALWDVAAWHRPPP